jgi:N-acetylglucosaminyldiphosphoundecaprenol N-acetyl-beta-D-mannosaminyltransferase
MQVSGLEWFYRLIQEPKRMFQRYLVDDLVFIRLALKEWNRARWRRTR